MLLKLKKEAFALTVIGVSISFVFAILLLLDGFQMHFIRYLKEFDWMVQNREFNIFIFFVMTGMGILFIIKPNKATAIISLICAIFAFNVLIFIAAILTLRTISELNQKAKIAEEEWLNQEGMENYGIIGDEPNLIPSPAKREVPAKRKAPTHVEFTSAEQTKIALGIAFASTYLALFALLFYLLIHNTWVEPGDESAAWLEIYLVFFLIILLFYSATIVINIVVSAIALNKKTYSSTKLMRVFGFISLTFINSFAAISALRRYY